MKIVYDKKTWDLRSKCKETQSLSNYQPLREEVGKLWGMCEVMVIPVIIGTLENSNSFEIHIKVYWSC